MGHFHFPSFKREAIAAKGGKDRGRGANIESGELDFENWVLGL
jgi:hypothetical protein